MIVIDKDMLEKFKSWHKRERPKNQAMIYVNSNDRILTNATIRKHMYEIEEEDIHGEEYVAFYSAKNFYRNMRDYFTEVSELYYKKPAPDTSIMEIVEQIPHTCGWITLIIEDIEALSDRPEEIQDMFMTLVSFACCGGNVILMGNGDYKDIFKGCENALNEFEIGLNAKEGDDELMIGYYTQEISPTKEEIVYETIEDQREELLFYWRTVYNQLEEDYFDYVDYKYLFRETLEYMIPRVTKEYVYREDLQLVHKIASMYCEKHENVDGCKLWEFEAAKKLTNGLHNAIINDMARNYDFSAGNVYISVIIDNRARDFGAIHISGSYGATIEICIDNVLNKMDNLAEVIHRNTYNGESAPLWSLLENDDSEASIEAYEKTGESISQLMSGILEAADRTVNKDPGRKVYRYKGVMENTTPDASEEEKIKILKRDYDVSVDKIKGIEKINPDMKMDMDKALLSRHIVVLDEERYSINDEGNPEMTQTAQKEYDDFIDKVHHMMEDEGVEIIDEGYGEGEDELEWHVSGCVINPEKPDIIAGVIEFDVSARTEDAEE